MGALSLKLTRFSLAVLHFYLTGDRGQRLRVRSPPTVSPSYARRRVADHASPSRRAAHTPRRRGSEDVSYRARSPTQTDTARERSGFRPFAPKLPRPGPRSVELATSWNGPDMCQPGGAYICAAFLKKKTLCHGRMTTHWQ